MVKRKDEKLRLIRANKLLIKVRWFYVAVLSVTGIISKITSDVSGANANVNFSSFWMVFLVALVLGYTVYFYLFFRKANNASFIKIKIFSFLQLIIDQIIITIIIFFAGGLTSISFLYYIYLIVASAFFFSFLETVIISTIASFLYGGLILLQFFEIVPYLARYNIGYESFLAHNTSAVITNLWAVITSFYIIGVIAGFLANNLRKKEKEIIIERDKELAIINNLLEGIIYIDNNNLVDSVNPQAEKILGFRAKKILGKNIKNINFEKLTLLRQVFDYSAEEPRELSFKNRPDMFIKIASVDIKDYEGKVIGTAKIIRDTSREKFVEKMKSEFITIASHQLRTPLSAIKGYLSLLKSGDYGKVSEKQRDALGKSYKHTEILITLVNDLLNVGSAQEGEYIYNFKAVDIDDLLKKLTERFVQAAKKKKVDFILKIINNPSGVLVDEYKIKLALGSIIGNAVSYTKEGGIIEVKAKFKGDKILINIADTGIGIPREVQDKVFTKFFRAENAVRHITEGNGLELFVAKNIIEKHNGQVWFKSQEGVGTTFFVELPVKQPKKDEANL